MILVRMVFQTKWGKAQEVVDEFKKNADMMRRVTGPRVRGRVLTDLSGPFHTVVQEMEVESLAEWERIRTAMFSDQEAQQQMGDPGDLLESGRAEFYTIEATYEG